MPLGSPSPSEPEKLWGMWGTPYLVLLPVSHHCELKNRPLYSSNHPCTDRAHVPFAMTVPRDHRLTLDPYGENKTNFLSPTSHPLQDFPLGVLLYILLVTRIFFYVQLFPNHLTFQ